MHRTRHRNRGWLRRHSYNACVQTDWPFPREVLRQYPADTVLPDRRESGGFFQILLSFFLLVQGPGRGNTNIVHPVMYKTRTLLHIVTTTFTDSISVMYT